MLSDLNPGTPWITNFKDLRNSFSCSSCMIWALYIAGSSHPVNDQSLVELLGCELLSISVYVWLWHIVQGWSSPTMSASCLCASPVGYCWTISPKPLASYPWQDLGRWMPIWSWLLLTQSHPRLQPNQQLSHERIAINQQPVINQLDRQCMTLIFQLIMIFSSEWNYIFSL